MENDLSGDESVAEEDDEQVEEFRRTPSFQDPEPDIDEDEDQEPAKQGVRTRFRGKKHVQIYSNEKTKTQPFENIKSGSILCKTNYNQRNNFTLSKFRGVDKYSFYARKQALEAHLIHCSQELCDACCLAQKVNKFVWDPTCLQRYNEKFEIHERSRKMIKKKVTFHPKVSFKHSKNFDLCINLSSLHHACIFNVSFREIRLLKTI